MKYLFCPVCCSKVTHFNPLPENYRLNAEKYGYEHFGKGETINISAYSCPKCGATDRDRLCALWLTLAKNSLFSQKKATMVHFAPERELRQFLKLNLNIGYRSCDIERTDVDDRIDMTSMTYSDSIFDFFICSHVLEHVSDDRKALRELFRILAPGAFGILLAPILTYLPNTIEELSELSPAERWKHFGQGDHRRLYAKDDFIRRIEDAGFRVYQWNIKNINRGILDLCGITITSTLYIAAKTENSTPIDGSPLELFYKAGISCSLDFLMSMFRLVTIAIPAYSKEYFRACLHSAITQDYQNIEIVICDDSGDDAIMLIVQDIAKNTPEIKIRYYKNEERLGGILNMQRCLEEADGVYIKYLNDDDIILSSCVSSLVSVIESDNRIGVVTSRRGLIDERGEPLPVRIHNVDPFGCDVRINGREIISFLNDHTINFIGEPSTVLFRTGDLRRILPTPNCLNGIPIRAVNDLAMYANILSSFDLAYVSETLSFFRIHPGQRQAQADMPMLASQGIANFRKALSSLDWTIPNLNSRVKCHPLSSQDGFFEISLIDELQKGVEIVIHQDRLARLIAFHLPQFHAIPENDAWWGKGFTEWDSVRQGKPLFDGHYQPHEPGEQGYYDLSNITALEKQARLALQYGLEGFCFYYYWFDGKRLLEKPVDQLLAHPEINLPFCLCWANENWTRRWDGGEKEILIQQSYSPENNQRFAHDLLPYLRAPRYIRVNGKPLVLVYRADIIPDLPTTIAAWRSTWSTEGIGEVYLVCVESFTSRIPQRDGFDAACEFFPHQLNFSQLSPSKRPNHLSDPQANVADYDKLITFAEARPQPGYKRFRGVIPSWDNAARRRKGGATLFVNASPSSYENWLKNTIRQTLIEQDGDERLVFINAWNEWGEGCHLEPDARYGRAWLEATLRALQTAPAVDVHYGRHIQPYQQWRMGRQLDRKELARLANLLGDQVRFTVVIDAIHASTEQLQVTLDSFVGEIHGYCRLSVVSPQPAPPNRSQSVSWLQVEEFPETLLLELAKASPDNWFCLIQAGDQIVESSLSLMEVKLSGTPLAGLVYGDEDTIDPKYGPSNPIFRPDFNLDYLRSYPYVGRFLLFRGREYLELGGLDWSTGSARFYDYTFRFYEQFSETAIHHLPTVLFHASQTQYEDAALVNHARVLEAHLQRSRIAAKVDTGLLLGSFRVHYLHQDRPRVSIIIPTKNQLPILRRCLESILENTTYKNYEILIVDNQSADADAVHYLHGLVDLNLPNLQVLSYPHAFNFADMNNLAVREAQGEYLVLLNNDTAIVKPDWLEALLNHAQRPDVGIVGAKLLYPDGKVQHGGVILGLRGPADHPFIGKAMDAPGYCGRLLVDQQYSAVTAACMMVRKSVYESVNGMDAEVFKVSYNDVDLCLKVREAGYRIIWTPHAILMHEGSVSQKQVDPATQKEKRLRFETEQRAMFHKWLPALIADPAYNPNLSLKGEGFELETNPLFNSYPDLILPKVLAHNGDTYGSGHYRVIQPLQALVESDLGRAAQSDRFLDAIHIAKLAPDIIVLQRQLTDGQLSNIETYREFSGAKIVYELDDYLPNLPIASVHKKDFPKDIWRRLRQITALCDRVTVSTPALKTALKDLHSDILVLPNYLPVDWWGNIESRQGFDKKGKPRIGWAGGASHKGDIRLIADVVKALADRVDWVFFGMMPEGVESIVAEYYPGVPIEDYPCQLAALNLDLALAPLENNLFNECKSNLRLLEYGICGYPVIATDIAPYQGTLPVTLVKNRFKDWVAAIEEKLADREALLTEGVNLQAAVRNNWMLEGENLMRWRDGWMLNTIKIERN